MFLKKKKEEINRATYLKYESGYYIMEKWVRVKQKGISLCQFFEDNNINNIAVYGMAELGELLCLELKNTSVNVRCGIDRRLSDKTDCSVNVVGVSDVKEYKGVQAIVVTPIQYFEDIEKHLRQNTEADIISLEDVIEYFM